MNIAIIGSGNVGKALASASVRAGHKVTLSAADPEHAGQVAAQTGAAAATSNREAVQAGDLVLLAVPYSAVDGILDEIEDVVAGKVVVDITNPTKADGSGLLFAGSSAAEAIQARVPAARVVKALNTVLAARMQRPEGDGTTLDGFMAGDDADAKTAVGAYLSSLGLRPLDAGPLPMAQALEALAYLNISLQIRHGWPWQTGSSWGPPGELRDLHRPGSGQAQRLGFRRALRCDLGRHGRKDPIDERAGLDRGETFGELHGFVDGNNGRDVFNGQHLEHGEAEYAALERGQALEGPALEVSAEEFVDLRSAFVDAEDQPPRVGRRCRTRLLAAPEGGVGREAHEVLLVEGERGRSPRRPAPVSHALLGPERGQDTLEDDVDRCGGQAGHPLHRGAHPLHDPHPQGRQRFAEGSLQMHRQPAEAVLDLHLDRAGPPQPALAHPHQRFSLDRSPHYRLQD